MEIPELLYITRFSRRKHDRIAEHLHDHTEFVLYTNGSGTTRISGREYGFSDGCIAVINKNTLHSEYHITGADVIFFSLHNADISIRSGIYRPDNFPVLLKIAMRAYAESKATGYGFNKLISIKAAEFLILLERGIRGESDSARRIESAMRFIKENCADKINISLLAARYGMSYESFRHLFKKVYGMSPHSFAVYHRLLNACSMLCGSDKSCTEIALMCGFTDGAQFSKMFKAQFGVTPRKFRSSVI